MATTWEELEQKYSSQAGAAPASGGDPWAALEKKYSNAVEPQSNQAKAAQQKQEPKDVSLTQKLAAGAAGVNKGFYSDLLGLPVDTAANAIDLLKAGIGYGTSKVTGKAPPEWTQPYNREEVPGTADWIAKNINKGSSALGVNSPINNPNPQDMASRVLYSGGRVAGASVVPNPRAAIGGQQQLMNAGMGAAGGLIGGAVGEVAPEYAGVAGMLPQLAAATAIAGTKKVVRGDEQGRQNMAQRIQDFKNAGVDEPSVGLASGNKGIMGLENLLAQTPGSSGLYAEAKQKMLDGMQARSNQIRDSISKTYGPVEAGSAIQKDLSQTGAFRDRVLGTERALMDKVQQYTGGDFVAPVDNSISAAKRLTTPIPGAENTLSPYMQKSIASLAGNLRKDSTRPPAPDGMGTLGNSASPPEGMPVAGIRAIRSEVGANTYDPGIIGKKESGQYKTMYAALSQDLQNAVNMADREGISRINYLRNKSAITPSEVVELTALEKMAKTPDGRAQIQSSTFGPLSPDQTPATTAYNRSNTYFRNAMGRVEDLNPLANRSTPEGAYDSVAKSLNAGPSVYERVRNAVTPETRQKVVATVIDELGAAKPGQQGAAGDAWSPATFLTNYNKIDQKSRSALFTRLPGGEAQAKNLADIAKAADMIKEGSKVWNNPSGTAAALSARGTIGALTVGAYFNPVVAAGTAGGLLVSNQASQRLLLNPKFTNWLAKVPTIRPQDAQSYNQRLIANARMTNDKQFQQDVADYLASVEQPANNDGNANSR